MHQVVVTEIFHSLQGESTQAGRPCVFIRLTGCPLRCEYCDTSYAFQGGNVMSLSQVLETVRSFGCDLVEVTGGEPSSQNNCILLLQTLCDEGFEVMIETSGAVSVEKVPQPVKIIMDIKTPASKEEHRNLWSNLSLLKPGMDEIKFVICDAADFAYTQEIAQRYDLCQKFTVLVSPAFGQVSNQELATWVLASKAPYRMQLQMHKYIWDPEQQGV
ncbi:MAG: radical SAM protein [Deltaproteobacteria bacterium]|nr:radical SAM protein [Deltaproteobacteria bacterium]